MFDITKSSLRFLALFGLASALMGAGGQSARADEDERDLIVKEDGGVVTIVPLDEDVPMEALFNRAMLPNPGFPDFPAGFPSAPFMDDTGFDVFPGIDVDPPYNNGEYQFQKVRVQQVAISEGIYGIYQYDGATPMFGNGPEFQKYMWLSEAQLDPNQIFVDGLELYFHQHFDMFATAPGVYTFDFRLTDIMLRDGTSLPDSQVYRITYVAGVPEPGAVALLLSGVVPMLGLALRRRRTR